MKFTSLSKSKYYQKKTTARAAMWGDFAIVMIPVMQGIIGGAPGLTENTKYWLASGATLVLVIIKFVLKTLKDEEVTDSSNSGIAP